MKAVELAQLLLKYPEAEIVGYDTTMGEVIGVQGAFEVHFLGEESEDEVEFIAISVNPEELMMQLEDIDWKKTLEGEK